jgi:hypothetical protein
MDRDEEEGLDDEIRLGELYLLLEEDLIRVLDRLGVEYEDRPEDERLGDDL